MLCVPWNDASCKATILNHFTKLNDSHCMYVCLYVCLHVCAYAHLYVRLYVCMYLYACMYACLPVCMYESVLSVFV